MNVGMSNPFDLLTRETIRSGKRVSGSTGSALAPPATAIRTSRLLYEGNRRHECLRNRNVLNVLNGLHREEAAGGNRAPEVRPEITFSSSPESKPVAMTVTRTLALQVPDRARLRR